MGTGRADHDRDLADAEPSHPVPEHDPHCAEATTRLPFDLPELAERRSLVGLIDERHDRTGSARVGAYPARKEYHSPEARSLQLAHRPVHRQRFPGQADAHVQPPPYGGCTANSSPSFSRTLRSSR